MAVSDPLVERYIELLQRFVRLRLDLMLPEHLVQFKQQMENMVKYCTKRSIFCKLKS